jgi:NAD-dependent deacetylase
MNVVILTGAGVSADSGVQTFRDAGGLWEGHRVEDVATPAAWHRDPETVWRFYQLRRAQLRTVEPNAAHRAIAALENKLRASGHGFVLITQNVDDLHQRAGSTVFPMHGELRVLRCEACDTRVDGLDYLDVDKFLPCPKCRHPKLRPDIVWFGEVPYHMDEIHDAVDDATHFISIGTSGVVYPATGLLAQARQVGAKTWVNSLDAPENLGSSDVFLPGRAVEVIPRFCDDWMTTHGHN